MEWSGAKWSGVEWSGVEWSGGEWSEAKRSEATKLGKKTRKNLKRRFTEFARRNSKTSLIKRSLKNQIIASHRFALRRLRNQGREETGGGWGEGRHETV